MSSSAKAAALQYAGDGNVVALRHLLEHHPEVLYSVTHRRCCRVVHGLMESVASQDASPPVVALVASHFCKHLQGERYDIAPAVFVACYSERHVYSSKFIAAADAIAAAVVPAHQARFVQAALPRWVRTTLSMIETDGRLLSSVFASQSSIDSPDTPFCMDRLLRHVKVARTLASMVEGCDVPFMEAVGCLHGLLIAWSNVVSHFVLAGALATTTDVFQEMATACPTKQALHEARHRCVDAITLTVGHACIPPFLNSDKCSTGISSVVARNVAHRLCDFYVIGAARTRMHLMSLRGVALRSRPLMQKRDASGWNAYALCAMKFGSMQLVWSTPDLAEAYRDIMSTATAEDLLALSSKATCAFVIVVKNAIRVAVKHLTVHQRVGLMDLKLRCLVRTPGFAQAAAQAPPYMAKIVISHAVKHGFLATAEHILAAALRRRSSHPDRLGWRHSTSLSCDLDAWRTTRNNCSTLPPGSYSHALTRFAEAAVWANAMSTKEAINFGADKRVTPFHAMHARRSKEQAAAVCAFMLAARRIGFCPEEIAIHCLSFVLLVDLGG